MSLTRTSLNSLLALVVAILLTAPSLFGQQFVAVNFPGATYTSVNGMDRNNSQTLVGNYIDTNGVDHGYIYTGGSYTTLDYPGNNITFPQDVNDLGQVVGQYYDANQVSHGFLYSSGTFTTVDFPGALSTFANAINNAGSIVGGYTDATGMGHGFMLSDGNFSTNDVPGATYTELDGINNQADLAGTFSDSQGTHGFLLNSSGMTTIDAPNSTDTFAQDLNDLDEVVGGYIQTGQSNTQAFTFAIVNGNPVITTIAYPGALTTDFTSLSDAGTLTGDYTSQSASGGFIQTSGPFAYVANNGNYSGTTVSMIDIPTSLPVTTITVGSAPYGVAVSPNGNQVYVTNFSSNNVSVINTASSSVVATIPVQLGPFPVAFTPDGASAYVVNGNSDSVSVIDTASQTVVATVPVQSGPAGVAMAFTSNGTFAYVTNYSSNTVSVIAVGSSPTVVQTIPVGTGPTGVAVAPNSSLAYVANEGSNSVSVISVATNTVTATIPVGTGPFGAAFTPDSNFAYVWNFYSNTVSVIDTASSNVVATVAGFNGPAGIAVTADGTSAYVTNFGANNVSVVTTASNTVTGAVTVGSGPLGVAIAAAPPTELQITQPLSPTQPNMFNFVSNNYQVQYPPGTQFTGVYMTVTSIEITQAQFQQRVAGTPFANATCIVYGGAGGNCIDDEVTCSSSPTGTPLIDCPNTGQSNLIDVETDFSTQQAIVNPGYLTTPIGQNNFTNIFTGFSDPKIKGQTSGFSEFLAVDLGGTNPQGMAQLEIIHPRLSKERHIVFGHENIPVVIRLTSIANGSAVTDAEVSISVVMIADAHGNPVQQTVLSAINAFEQTGAKGIYKYNLDTADYALGTYTLTIYGNAFPAYEGQFKIVSRAEQ